MMNQHYEVLARSLGIPEIAISIARGDIEIPVATYRAPAGDYGFPPALIPLWSDGSMPEYIGYWQHWFVPRKPVLVKCDVESGYYVTEIARSFDQLLRPIALETMCIEG